IELNDEYRVLVEQRLGEMGFPEVTAAYQTLRDAREVEWKKTGPAFSKRHVGMIFVGILRLGSLRSPLRPAKHAEGGGLLSEDALPGRRHRHDWDPLFTGHKCKSLFDYPVDLLLDGRYRARDRECPYDSTCKNRADLLIPRPLQE
ncbi:hypothetical protein C8A05DRAFT_17464, partial [Staphylotrichum tortipilum]